MPEDWLRGRARRADRARSTESPVTCTARIGIDADDTKAGKQVEEPAWAANREMDWNEAVAAFAPLSWPQRCVLSGFVWVQTLRPHLGGAAKRARALQGAGAGKAPKGGRAPAPESPFFEALRRLNANAQRIWRQRRTIMGMDPDAPPAGPARSHGASPETSPVRPAPAAPEDARSPTVADRSINSLRVAARFAIHDAMRPGKMGTMKLWQRTALRALASVVEEGLPAAAVEERARA